MSSAYDSAHAYGHKEEIRRKDRRRISKRHNPRVGTSVQEEEGEIAVESCALLWRHDRRETFSM